MSAALLIQSIVRQTTILLAQLGNTGEERSPLAHLTTQVFYELAQELERMGVTRRVSADMFGLGQRTHKRKRQRTAAVAAVTTPTLRQKVLEYIQASQVASRTDILGHFPHADEAQLRAILRDLSECGQLFIIGKGTSTAYRATTGDEATVLRSKYISNGFTEAFSNPKNEISPPILVNAAGEGTYAVAIWQGHPLEQEALELLRQLRQMLADLRTQLAEANESSPPADGTVTREPKRGRDALTHG